MKQFDGKSKFNLPKVLVTSMYGHDDMLDYLSDYRTQDTLRGKHYYPKGALCWFECNRYGDPLGSVYIARLIPDMELIERSINERGYRRLLRQKTEKMRLSEILSRDRENTEQIKVVKPQIMEKEYIICQQRKRKKQKKKN